MNVFQTLAHIARTEGVVQGLMLRGLVPSAARAVSLNVGFLAGNTTIKERLRQANTTNGVGGKGHHVPDGLIVVVSAMAAGALSCVTSQPADLLKVRLMALRAQSGAAGMSSPSTSRMIWSIVRTEGISGLYRGFSAYLIKQAPMATMTLLFQEGLRRGLA